jgi:hypothetical protein
MNYINRIKPASLTSTIRLLLSAVLLSLSLLAYAGDVDDAADTAEGFNHFSTGFPLTGRHELIDCSGCHLAGQFKGTPLECHLCHNGLRAQGKHPQHFPSSIFCDDCHTDYTWLGARFDHIDVRGACLNCHNNIMAIGKSPSHILSTDTCEDCHNTITFDPVTRVDHISVIGVCSSCHNGVIATGKPAGHIPTTDECNACHTTTTWSGAIAP